MADKKRPDAEGPVAQSPDDIEQLTEFDKVVKGIAGTPKAEVDKIEKREKKRREANGSK